MVSTDLIKRAQKLAFDNSPTILTAIGVTGTITTAFLTGRASFKATAVLRDENTLRNLKNEEPVTGVKEHISVLWTLYVPAVGTGVLTISAIIFANRIGMRRAAAIAAAYSISERAFTEYKEKVIERLGATKEQKIRDEVAQDRVNANPVSSREVIITGQGDVLCYDSITGRYFQSNVESIRKAQNDVNAMILRDMYASLYDFYNFLDIPTTPYSSEVGWNTDSLLELEFSAILAEDGRPCISIDYRIFPIREYSRLQ